jgi:hypothetical protein
VRGLQFGLRLIHYQEIQTCGNLHSYECSVRKACKVKRCAQCARVNVELERANEYKYDLLAAVTHELRNAIQPIIASACVLQTGASTPPNALPSNGAHIMPHD